MMNVITFGFLGVASFVFLPPTILYFIVFLIFCIVWISGSIDWMIRFVDAMRLEMILNVDDCNCD